MQRSAKEILTVIRILRSRKEICTVTWKCRLVRMHHNTQACLEDTLLSMIITTMQGIETAITRGTPHHFVSNDMMASIEMVLPLAAQGLRERKKQPPPKKRNMLAHEAGTVLYVSLFCLS